ncbi:MAG: competence/damage-inducible protein A [SAR324 cluster bacterium]|nr:competence/damage-inducible protein A [SAR324 cluster bacterium]
MTRTPDTAAIVVIGNEILSGKVKDSNSYYLCQELRFLGVDVHRILTVPDEIDLVGKLVKEYAQQFTWVFTSGGIGPTHDDITIESIAKAFGVATEESPRLAQLIRDYYKDQCTPAHLRMAKIPKGAQLLEYETLSAPQLQFHNIIIFPGIPELLRERFNGIKEMFRQDPIFLREIFMKIDESLISELLDKTMMNYPALLLGSYPTLWRKDYTLKLTLESREKSYLQEAFDYLMDHLPKDKMVQF